MVEFTAIKPGDVLYSCQRRQMGNTTIRETVCLRVKVIEVHDDHALCSMNGNPPRKYYRHSIKQLRRSPLKKEATQ